MSSPDTTTWCWRASRSRIRESSRRFPTGSSRSWSATSPTTTTTTHGHWPEHNETAAGRIPEHRTRHRVIATVDARRDDHRVEHVVHRRHGRQRRVACTAGESQRDKDRKSTRLNSSHLGISYAVFCLKKKNNIKTE